MNTETLYNQLEDAILQLEIDESTKDDLLKQILKLKSQTINIMITGATGCGKSSTINALFNTKIATVGVGADPQTMSITKYELDNLTLWDTPGLGDGKEADNLHAKNIIRKLTETDESGNALIDLVVVILDGNSRDLGTSYELINEVIIPTLGPEKSKRILVAINQADMAMKGRHWDYNKSKPDDVLKDFLDKKVLSVKKRIFEATGITVEPIYYSAGYTDENGIQDTPYNLSKLLYYIVQSTPTEKRTIYISNTNSNPEMWKNDDELQDYGEETRNSILESIGSIIHFGEKFVKNETVQKFVKGAIHFVSKVVGGIFGKIL